MSPLTKISFEPALERLPLLLGDCPAGSVVEAWTFDGEDRRRAAERRLAAMGLEARVRSAYKPLLHHFLEELDRGRLVSARVEYPVREGCAPDRFLLEAYPLAALLGRAELSFEGRESDSFEYSLSLAFDDGRREERRVLAPNRVRVDHIGATIVSPCGWLRVRRPDGTETDEAFETEYEAIYAEALRAIEGGPWGEQEPFFERLTIRATLPSEDRPLPAGEEAVSLREALHEDLYFSALELFQKRTGRGVGDRSLMPGQIVPEILLGAGPSLEIETALLRADEQVAADQELERAERPLSAAQVRSELAKIEGLPFETRSFAGRPIRAVYRAGSDLAVMISGGQHANETSGVVGALRAARELSRRPGAHFTVSPLENPDGYALHRELCARDPRHMHHAARYTALGNDLEYQPEGASYERGIRVEALRLANPMLHVNLHGYPSHEWNRPLSGYVPRGFPSWMLPHGFLLVLRHHEGWADEAERLLELVAARLNELPGLRAFSDEQLRLHAIHARTRDFRLVGGFPCLVTQDAVGSIPLRLITEYPDETISGAAFVAAHDAQAAAALAAYEAYQTVAAGKASRGPSA